MCRFLPANEKKNFSLAATLKKKREKGQEKREIYSREISSVVSILSLLAFLINSLERTNEGGTRNTIRALTEKEERGPRFRERAEQSF